jgi:hypothetical protein
MPDAMRIKDLNLGDRFRFFDGTGTVYGPVASAENDYTLSGTTVRLDGGASVDRHAWSCVEVTHSAPLCPCGRAFERCELDCPWPTDLVELSIRYG